jgi:hydrogenase nickel incorporation protein HypB
VGDAPHVTPTHLARGLAAHRHHELDLVFVENVGDFVGPATYRLDTHLNVRITTPLDDARRPYDPPQLLMGLNAIVLNQSDRVNESAFDPNLFLRGLHALNPNLIVMPVSSKTGDGIDEWTAWLARCRSTRMASRHPPHREPKTPDSSTSDAPMRWPR